MKNLLKNPLSSAVCFFVIMFSLVLSFSSCSKDSGLIVQPENGNVVLSINAAFTEDIKTSVKSGTITPIENGTWNCLEYDYTDNSILESASNTGVFGDAVGDAYHFSFSTNKKADVLATIKGDVMRSNDIYLTLKEYLHDEYREQNDGLFDFPIFQSAGYNLYEYPQAAQTYGSIVATVQTGIVIVNVILPEQLKVSSNLYSDLDVFTSTVTATKPKKFSGFTYEPNASGDMEVVRNCNDIIGFTYCKDELNCVYKYGGEGTFTINLIGKLGNDSAKTIAQITDEALDLTIVPAMAKLYTVTIIQSTRNIGNSSTFDTKVELIEVALNVGLGD